MTLNRNKNFPPLHNKNHNKPKSMCIDIDKKDITDIEALRNESLFNVVFSRYAGDLYIKAAQYLNQDDAKDLAQELLIEIWNKRMSIIGNSEGSIRGYISIRLKYKILDHYSKQSERVLWEEALPELMEMATNTTHETTLQKELYAIIEETTHEMNPSELAVFRLRWEQQLSVLETANTLGISKKSVMNRFASAMKKIRTQTVGYYNESPVAEYQLTVLTLVLSQLMK